MRDLDFINEILAMMPYAKKLGVEATLGDSGGLICSMAFNENHVGNKQLPALHGGSLASFLEITAILELARQQMGLQDIKTIEAGRAAMPIPVNVTVQYLRSARALPCRAEAKVLKAGRRTSTVFCQAWQEDADKPVTSLTGVFIQPKS
ncbi:MAG: PaaI family thioesterase [Parvibaculales bacterium]|nr:PaaI family thioesterase [Alphaproteobacteria bacterium]